MKYYATTDIGRKYNHNEDAYALPEPNKKFSIDKPDTTNMGSLFVLCDGMGGANAGEIASNLTAHWILKDYYSRKSKNNHISDLKKIIKSVNTRIYNLAKENESYHGMGTTIVAVLIYEKKAYIFSVGDSRVYILRDFEFKQITEDQSEVWQLYASGEITKDEIRSHPRNNVLTMALGVSEEIELQEYEYPVQKRDMFLLCSDGLSDMIGDAEIKKILLRRKSLKRISNDLINAANKKGGKDNITTILIKI